MKVPFMDFSRMHLPLQKDFEESFERISKKGNFILGEEVKDFERAFAEYCGAKGAVGVSTGTDALELALRSFGIGPGDEVITAPNSFIASASGISQAGATPVFADVLYETSNINPVEIEKRITPRTKAIIPVHLYGQPAEMNSIKGIAKEYGLRVIEDSCQAHGAKYFGNRTGSLGDAAAFSFYPGKNLGGFGDGGILVSNDEEILKNAGMFRNYGQSKKYHHELLAFNKRLDTIQAAMLGIKLPHLDSWNESRRESAKVLNEGLERIVETPVILEGNESVYHLYVVRAKNESERDALQNYLWEKNIQTGLHYPVAIHLQKAYSDLGLPKGDFPVAEDLCERGLTLPMFPYMKQDELGYIVDSVKEFYKR